MKNKILKILKDHSSGCKEIDLIADLTIQLFADGLMTGSGEPFDIVAFDIVLLGLLRDRKIDVVEYSHEIGDGYLRAKRFIHLL